jgi:hypothetical protein
MSGTSMIRRAVVWAIVTMLVLILVATLFLDPAAGGV